MDWIYLLIAGAFEICFTTSLKLTDGFTKIVPTCLFIVFAFFSFWFLNKSLQTIPLGIAYAVWTGIGAAGTACVGVWFFGDYLGVWKGLFLANLIFSILGIKFIGN